MSNQQEVSDQLSANKNTPVTQQEHPPRQEQRVQIIFLKTFYGSVVSWTYKHYKKYKMLVNKTAS